TKPRILEAVREAKGEQAAQLIDHLKKGDMAREAERLLEGTGWLPEPLRGIALHQSGNSESPAQCRAFAFSESVMPEFTIETTFRLPVYRHRTYEAES